MANLVKELNELDFSCYIGGPLQAAIQAQCAASFSEVGFIKEVGFKKDGGLEYVDFSYTKTVPGVKTETNQNPPPVDEKYKLTVPLLSLLTIPAIRIDELTIDFNVKLTSCETTDVETVSNVGAAIGVGWGRLINFKASASYRRKTTSSTEVNKTYDLAVHVRAVNDELPAGLERVLRIIESEVEENKVKNGLVTNPS